MKTIYQTIKSEWIFLDGKKTLIGATLLVLTPYLNDFNSSVLAGQWNLHWAFITPFCNTLLWFGNALTTVGLLHKAAKIVTPVKA